MSTATTTGDPYDLETPIFTFRTNGLEGAAGEIEIDDLQTWLKFMLVRWQTNAWWEGYRVGANFHANTWEAYEFLGLGYAPGAFFDFQSEKSIMHVLSNWYLGGKSLITENMSDMQRAWFVYGCMEALKKAGRL